MASHALLLVGPEQEVLELARLLGAALGLRAARARSTAQARSALRENRPLLVVIDCAQTWGIVFACSRRPGLAPATLCLAPDADTEATLRAAGVQQVLRWPFCADTLFRAMRDALQQVPLRIAFLRTPAGPLA